MNKRNVWIVAGVLLLAIVVVFAVITGRDGRDVDKDRDKGTVKDAGDGPKGPAEGVSEIPAWLKKPNRMEKLFPNDTMAFFSAEHVKTSWARAKESALYKLYNDKDIQKFLKNTIRDIDEMMKDIEEKVGFRWDDIVEVFPDQLGIGLIDFQEDGTPNICAAGNFGYRLPELQSVLDRWRESIKQKKEYVISEYEVKDLKINITSVHEPDDENTGLKYAILDNKIFIIGNGRDTVEKMVATYLGKEYKGRKYESLSADPAYLNVVSKLDKDPDTVTFVRFGELWRHFYNDKNNMVFYTQFGFFDVKGIGISTTFVGDGIKDTIYIYVPGEKRGIPALMSQPPINRKTINTVPGNSLFVLSVKCDPKKTWNEFMRALRDGGDPTYASINKNIRSIEKTSHIDWQKDVIEQLTGEITATLGISTRGMIPYVEFTFFAEVKDPKKAEAALINIFKPEIPDTKGMTKAEAEIIARKYENLKLKKYPTRALDGKVFDIYSRLIPDNNFFPDIAFAIRDNTVIIGRYTSVKNIFFMPPDKFLDKNEDYRKVIGEVDTKGASAFGYLNMISGVNIFYDKLMAILTKASNFTQGFSFVDPENIPPRNAFLQYLSGVGGCFYSDKDGFYVRMYSRTGGQFLGLIIAPFVIKYNDLSKQGEVEKPLKMLYGYLMKWVDDHASRMGVMPGELKVLIPEYLKELPGNVGYFPYHNANSESNPLTGEVVSSTTIPLLYSTEKIRKGYPVLFLDGAVRYLKKKQFEALLQKENRELEARKLRWEVERPLMMVARAIQKYSNNQDIEGSTPAKLSDLVPEYMDSLPEDIGYVPGRDMYYGDTEAILIYSKKIVPGWGRPVVRVDKKLIYVSEDEFKKLIQD